MLRKQLAVALAALLAVVACAPCARAQSGRRFPRAAGDKGFVALTDVKSSGTRTEKGGEPDLRSPHTKGTAQSADDDNDDDEENAGSDAKIAALIIVGVIVLFGVANVKSKGYAPAGTGAPFRRVH